jgi:DNA-binding IclR family transcriptional regulator
VKKTSEAEPAQGVAAVDRALTIMNVFIDVQEPLRLVDISAATGLYKSTVLRLIASLERFGYIRRLEDGRFLPGPTPFVLGRSYQNGLKLSDHIIPVLRRLVKEGTESPSFHVREGDARVCLFRINSDHSTLDRISEGDTLPLERGAPGRVLLAFDGEKGEMFDEIRSRWYAVSYGERDRQCASVASPVMGLNGKIIGALSLSGPLNRFTDERIVWLNDKVCAAAADLTRTLGGTWNPPSRTE